MANKTELSEEAKEARKAYLKQWKKDNPDKVRAANKRYWEKKAQEARELKRTLEEG